jgi:transcriptional regulator with XRE-family HTH domain
MLILVRESRDWSQKQLADRLWISQSAVSKYENGMAQVPEQHLAAIARALNYTPEFF